MTELDKYKGLFLDATKQGGLYRERLLEAEARAEEWLHKNAKQAERLEKCESALKEATQALGMLWPLAMDSVPRRGHIGGCGPEAGCDAICMEVATIADTLRRVDFTRKKIAEYQANSARAALEEK